MMIIHAKRICVKVIAARPNEPVIFGYRFFIAIPKKISPFMCKKQETATVADSFCFPQDVDIYAFVGPVRKNIFVARHYKKPHWIIH
jgi:hypothetical protein